MAFAAARIIAPAGALRLLEALRDAGYHLEHLPRNGGELVAALQAGPTNAAVRGRRVGERLARLKDRGVRLALDDFGSGYAALSQLAKMPFDVLKLDRGLIRGIEADRAVQNIFRGITQFANELGYKVIVEGVENDAHLEFISDECDFFGVQGFHLFPPLEADSTLELLASMPRRGNLDAATAAV